MPEPFGTDACMQPSTTTPKRGGASIFFCQLRIEEVWIAVAAAELRQSDWN
jgi:hypothetical protein